MVHNNALRSNAIRRDMQEVLARWGRWAASEEYCSLVDWPAMSVIRYRTPDRERRQPHCSDEDGRAIDTCIAHMSTVRQADDLLILGLRFIAVCSLRQIAQITGEGRDSVHNSLRVSEAFVSGCLVMQGIQLDMDLEVLLPEKLASRQKPMLLF